MEDAIVDECCFSDPAHHHAQVLRFNHYSDPKWIDGIHNGLCNLGCQAFLYFAGGGQRRPPVVALLLSPITFPRGI